MTTFRALIARLDAIQSEIGELRRVLDAEQLAVSDRQYVTRCFDLLTMELEALRQYLDGLTSAI